MLHGGGPGASGRVELLPQHRRPRKAFRVIVPDMPGYGRSVKGVDQTIRSVTSPT